MHAMQGMQCNEFKIMNKTPKHLLGIMEAAYKIINS